MLLLDISIVQAFQASRNPILTPPRRPPDYYTTLSQHPHRRTSAVAYTTKINKYQDVCTANGVSFLPFIIESNGYIHPQARQFLQDLAKQAVFIVISPGIICICFISLSSLHPSNLPFTALS
jgi:hypothetical protein